MSEKKGKKIKKKAIIFKWRKFNFVKNTHTIVLCFTHFATAGEKLHHQPVCLSALQTTRQDQGLGLDARLLGPRFKRLLCCCMDQGWVFPSPGGQIHSLNLNLEPTSY